MNEESGKKFLKLAQTLKTLTDWEGYAWGQSVATSASTADAVVIPPGNPQLWGDHFTGDYGIQLG